MKAFNFYCSMLGWSMVAAVFFTGLFAIAGQEYTTVHAIFVGLAVPMIVGPLYVED